MPKLTDLPECPHTLGPASSDGCWYCGALDGTAWFSIEFDTYVHPCCLRRSAEKGLEEENQILLEEFDISV